MELTEETRAWGRHIIVRWASECKIGVTGHRVLMDIEKLCLGLTQALLQIEAAFLGRRLVLYSSLAEGADQLAAEVVLQRFRGKLIAVLPLPVSDYRLDFLTADGRAALDRLLASADAVITMEPAETHAQAHEDAGRRILDECDVLLALWDGREPQGQGGSGQIVAAARAQSKPVVIIRAGNRIPGTNKPTTLGDAQGEVISERLSAP